MSATRFRQNGLGMPSPYVFENNKATSVGARHASPVLFAVADIFFHPPTRPAR